MQVMIVGAGRLGLKLIEALMNGNFDVVVMDSNIRVIERVKEQFDVMTVHANGFELSGIKEINMREVNLLIALTSSDESNTLICTMAKKLGCQKTIARVRNPEISGHMDLLRNELGVDHIINPEFIAARDMARILLKPFSLPLETFAKGKLSFVRIPARGLKDIVGLKVKDIRLSGSIQITAVAKDDTIYIPNGDTILEQDHHVFFAGLSEDIERVLNRYGSIYRKPRIQNALLIGGGKTGFYLANLLRKAKVQVTVIESNRERCNYIAERLPEVLVVNGDGTDMSILIEEGLQKTNAFIGITNDDEKNILMSLVAKQYAIRTVITSISNPHYTQIAQKIGLEGAISPLTLTIGSILKFVRGDKVTAMALLHDGKAEVTEVRVTKDSGLLNLRLNAVNLPYGLLILGLERGQLVMTAKSDECIQVGDKLVVFCLTKSIGNLELLLRSKRGGFIGELFSHHKNDR